MSGSLVTLYSGILFMFLLLMLSFASGIFLKRIHSHYFGETAATMLIGAVAGGLFYVCFGRHTNLIELSAEFFYIVLLPPIIFEAGYSMKKVNFFKNFHTILALAFLGTAISAALGGLVVYLGCLIYEPISFIEAITYGSLLSATDTVSVLATLQELPIDKNLYITVFGESALNDAVALIIYKFVYSFAKPEATFTASSFAVTGLLTLGVFLGSVGLGLVFGMMLAKILKHSKLYEGEVTIENALILLFAYSSYFIAEILDLSGIVCILFCGISMAHYAFDNLSSESRDMSKKIIRLLSFTCETTIFVYLGLAFAAFQGERTSYNVGFIFISIIAVLLPRVHVFIICSIGNLFKKAERRISFKKQIFLWYANLRGGLCFVIALQLSTSPYFSEEYRHLVLATTLMLVFVTVLIMGAGTPLVLQKLGLILDHSSSFSNNNQPEEKLLLTESSQKENTGVGGVEDSSSSSSPSVLHRVLKIFDFHKLKSLDKKYIKPYLTNVNYGMLDYNRFTDYASQSPPKKTTQDLPEWTEEELYITSNVELVTGNIKSFPPA